MSIDRAVAEWGGFGNRLHVFKATRRAVVQHKLWVAQFGEVVDVSLHDGCGEEEAAKQLVACA